MPPPPATITPATRDDAEAILQLQRLAYRSEAERYQDWDMPPLKESLEQLFAEFDRQTFLKASADEPPRIVGSVRAFLRDDTCYVGRLIVHPQCEGKGIGSTLLRAIEQHFARAQRFELFTGHQSQRTIALYQRHGYAPFRQERISDTLSLVFLEKTSPRR